MCSNQAAGKQASGFRTVCGGTRRGHGGAPWTSAWPQETAGYECMEMNSPSAPSPDEDPGAAGERQPGRHRRSSPRRRVSVVYKKDVVTGWDSVVGVSPNPLLTNTVFKPGKSLHGRITCGFCCSCCCCFCFFLTGGTSNTTRHCINNHPSSASTSSSSSPSCDPF